MTYTLHDLKNNVHRPHKQRVGRGIGSGRGKTCCRGTKGDKSRSGYKRRASQEGGAARIFTRLPTRGFTRGKFLRPFTLVNLSVIEAKYKDGEEVNLETLKAKKIVRRKKPYPLKVLGRGDIIRKVKISARHFTKSALQKIEQAKVEIRQ